VLGGKPPLFTQVMRKTLLGLIALPIALISGTNSAMAYGYGYTPYSQYSISAPGGYYGTYNQMGGYHTYTDNYGSTTCSAMGNYINCW